MKDYENSKKDEMLTILEELQDENEKLQDQISEAQQTTSQLLSENSVLKSELQKKSETIVSLNGQIERLNGSDLVLKKNEQLVRQNRELQRSAQNAREEAEAAVSAAEKEYAAREQKLNSQMREAVRREQIARDMEINYKDKVTEEARRITEKARALAEEECRRKTVKAENKYREKRDAFYAVTIGSLLYSFLATILTACNSTRFTTDAASFASFLWKLITGAFRMAVEACKTVWNVKEMIPYQPINHIVAAILVITVFVLITGLIYGLTGFIIYEAACFYHEEFWDLISGVVALFSMGLLVWSADKLTWITWNLILVWLLIHGGYVLIRMMASGSRSN